jgi:predicted nucleic acid-binding protein
MNSILVDTSIWIEYFKGNEETKYIDSWIETNQICINDLILAELVPSLKVRKEYELIDLLESLVIMPIEINWKEIIEYQEINLKNGINRVGIPDLIITQNVIQNNVFLCTLDKHFELMSANVPLKLVQYKTI